MLRKSIIALFVLLSAPSIFSQANIADSAIGLTSVGIQYTASFADGEFRNDYNFFNGIGLDVFHKFKSNWSVGADIRFHFGNKIFTDNFFGDYLSDGNFVITNNGTVGSVVLGPRAWDFAITVGKLFPWFGPNDNSGVQFRFSAGMLAHYVFIDPRDAYMPQFVDPYGKGYDRMHMGPQIKQGIYYFFYGSEKTWLNFSIGGEVSEAYTTNVRRYNYSEMAYDTAWQWDFMYSIKVAYILPVYRKAARLL